MNTVIHLQPQGVNGNSLIEVSNLILHFSEMFPHQLLSVSSLNTDTTPESLYSLEHVSYDDRAHLLSGLSPGKLDRQFSDYSSSSGSDGNKDWWEGEDKGGAYLVEEYDDDNDDVFIKEEFEGRELSIVLEETEVEESDSDATDDDVNKIVTGVCTIGNSIQIENHVSTFKSKDKGKQKRVTFAVGSPVIINRKSSISSMKEDSLEMQGDREIVSSTTKYEELIETKSCKKCKQEKKLNLRMSLSLGTSQLKAKKSVFKIVLGWFERFF